MHVEKSSVICQLVGLVSAQQYTLSFKMPKATHQLCATSQGFTDWLSTSTTLGKVLGITEAKASLVFFYLTGFPSVLQSVSVRILICPVNIILVSSVAKTTFKRWARKQTQLQRLPYFILILTLCLLLYCNLPVLTELEPTSSCRPYIIKAFWISPCVPSKAHRHPVGFTYAFALNWGTN